jgi:hypothetical protein
MDEANWTVVYSAQGKLSAEILRLLLESFEIPSVLSQESVGATYGLTVGDLGEVDILVPADRVEEAVAILHDMEAGKLEVDDSSADQDDNVENSPED